MLIAIDASRANNLHKTGTEWYSWHLIEAIKKLDNKNQFILYSREKLRGELAELPSNFKSKVLRWPPKRFWTQLRLSWEMLFHRPDVLFVPAHTIPLVHPKKTITTLHDVGFARRPELYSKKELSYHNWAAKYAVKNARKIITISQFSRQEVIDLLGIDKDRIETIYLGYEKSQYRADLDKEKIREVVAKHRIKEPYFFYIGRLEKKKNVLTLIKAFNNLRQLEDFYDINLVLAGQPGLGYGEIKEYIQKNNLKDSIIETGWLEQKEAPYLLAGSLALVMPSYYEGFCLPVLEAMACGVPVIGSNSSAIPEITAGAALLFDPSDKDKLAELMKKIIQNEELRQELMASGVKRALDFSWDKCAKKTLETIYSLK